jgi:hypothetical protein
MSALVVVCICTLAPSEVTVHVTPADDGRGLTVAVHAVLPARIAALDRILSDARRYPSWIPAIREVTPSAEDFDVFDTTWQLAWPLGVVHERLRVTRTVAGKTITIAWRQLKGDLRRDEGAWTLTPLGARTEVSYRATFQLHRWIPTPIVRHVQHRAARRLLANLVAYAQRSR